MKTMIRTVSLVAVTLTLVAMASADVVELITGERVEGKFRQAIQAGVDIEVAGQTMTIPLEKVRAIYFGAAPVAGASTPIATTATKPDSFTTALNLVKGFRVFTEHNPNKRDYNLKLSETETQVNALIPETIKLMESMGLWPMNQVKLDAFKRRLETDPVFKEEYDKKSVWFNREMSLKVVVETCSACGMAWDMCDRITAGSVARSACAPTQCVINASAELDKIK